MFDAKGPPPVGVHLHHGIGCSGARAEAPAGRNGRAIIAGQPGFRFLAGELIDHSIGRAAMGVPTHGIAEWGHVEGVERQRCVEVVVVARRSMERLDWSLSAGSPKNFSRPLMSCFSIVALVARNPARDEMPRAECGSVWPPACSDRPARGLFVVPPLGNCLGYRRIRHSLQYWICAIWTMWRKRRSACLRWPLRRQSLRAAGGPHRKPRFDIGAKRFRHSPRSGGTIWSIRACAQGRRRGQSV